MISEMLVATASVKADDDATDSGLLLEAGLTYTTEGGAALTANYKNENAEWDGDETHEVVLKASYSF
jgi:hypothetical protein